MGTRYLGVVSGPPREAKLGNKSARPKPKAVWKRLLSVWKRMEAFGNDSKGMVGLGLIVGCLDSQKNKKMIGEYGGLG
jgi:hypothetical protein